MKFERYSSKEIKNIVFSSNIFIKKIKLLRKERLISVGKPQLYFLVCIINFQFPRFDKFFCVDIV